MIYLANLSNRTTILPPFIPSHHVGQSCSSSLRKTNSMRTLYQTRQRKLYHSGKCSTYLPSGPPCNFRCSNGVTSNTYPLFRLQSRRQGIWSKLDVGRLAKTPISIHGRQNECSTTFISMQRILAFLLPPVPIPRIPVTTLLSFQNFYHTSSLPGWSRSTRKSSKCQKRIYRHPRTSISRVSTFCTTHRRPESNLNGSKFGRRCGDLLGDMCSSRIAFRVSPRNTLLEL